MYFYFECVCLFSPPSLENSAGGGWLCKTKNFCMMSDSNKIDCAFFIVIINLELNSELV